MSVTNRNNFYFTDAVAHVLLRELPQGSVWPTDLDTPSDIPAMLTHLAEVRRKLAARSTNVSLREPERHALWHFTYNLMSNRITHEQCDGFSELFKLHGMLWVEEWP